MYKDMKKKSGKLRIVLTGFFTGILILGLFMTADYLWNAFRQQQKQEKLEARVVDQNVLEEQEEINPIDFDNLWAVNKDVYAWIYIPGTNISYPVLQHPDDNTYYLEHTIEGEKTRPGTIYSENYNSKDFSDYNTILYGHNMHSNGTMFYQLHNFENKDFLNQNNQIIIYLPQQRLTYKIIAVAVVDDSHLMYKYENFNDEGKEAFWKMLQDTNEPEEYFDSSYVRSEDEHLLTLSTCIYRREENRFLVVGALVEQKLTK